MNTITPLLILTFFLISLLFYSSIEHFCCDNPENPYDYNYDKENPNATVSGMQVAGTVYASYPKNTPGLGWIL